MLVIAHRGAMLKAPENSLEAFSAAVDEGAHRIELDLQLSQDHKIFVCHEDNTARLTSQPLIISQTPSEQLVQLRLENGEPLCRLEDVLQWWSYCQNEVSLNLEIKPVQLPMVTALGDQLAPLDRALKESVVISSRSTEVLAWCRDHPVLSCIPTALIWECQAGDCDYVSRWQDLHTTLTRLAIRIIHPKATMWHHDLQWRAKAENYLVYTWSSAAENEWLDNCRVWHKILEWRVDGHCTNMPLEFGRFLRHCMVDVPHTFQVAEATL